MCGIAGWIDYKENLRERRPAISAMAETLAHRGPDAGGFWDSEEALLAHRRLIVVDPENGKQPMSRTVDGAEYVLTYNGELYNTEDIRAKLLALGYRFEGHSDTEVLLYAYIAWGEACLDELNGIYAFAIWNQREKTLFLARDRIGVKPLFYHVYEGGILFASEIKALLAHPKVRPAITKEGVASLLLLGPGRPVGDGIFRDVKELPPGHFAILRPEGLAVHRYWSLRALPHTETAEESIEHLRELLLDSIRGQLVSDVPLCTFLSGGLDSSIISAVAAEEFRRKGVKLHTYSVDYIDNDRNFRASAFQPNEDAPWAKKMSEFLETEHHRVLIDTPELIESLYAAVYARDLPGMADVDSSLLLFGRVVKHDYTVALSGECADELFAGYPWYHNPDILWKDGFPWSRSTTQRAALMHPELLRGIDPEEFVDAHYRATIAGVESLDSDSPLDRRMREMFHLNVYWFMQTLLDRKDRMTMACGLEARVPFCDHRLTEYAYNLPWKLKAMDGREKGLLRRVAESFLPPEIVWRKKSPYPKTHNPNYLAGCRSILSGILNDRGNRITELIPAQRIQELIETNAAAFGETPWYGQLMSTAQVFAYLIQLEYWLQRYNVQLI